MFAWLWNYLSGYVIISVEGLSLEKFLNLAANGGVKLWDVRRSSYTRLTARVSRAGFRKLRACLKGLRNTKIHIETKHGAPFRLSFLRFRKALLFGALLFGAAMVVASTYVWDVSVEGCERVSAQAVLKAVEGSGARRFAKRKDLGMLEITQAAMAADARIAWAGAKLKGARLVVEIVESLSEPELLAKDEPADIVALKDAVVKEITVLEGVAKAAVNSAVRAGDVLISGTIPHNYTATRVVRARGEILGRVWYKSTARIGTRRVVMKRTGKSQTVTRISIAEWEVQPGSSTKYAQFESEPIISKTLGGLFVPVRYVREVQYELAPSDEPLSTQEMMAAAKEMALARLYERVDQASEILGITAKYTENEDALLCELFAEALEPVGVVKEYGAAGAFVQIADPDVEEIWTVP